MLIVGEISALAALASTGRLEILRQLFRNVAVPEGVRSEFERANGRLPWWIAVRPARDGVHVAELRHWLDEQEAESIILYRELVADALLMDDHIGRRIARQEGAKVIGLVGVLLLAKRRGMVASLKEVLSEVARKSGFTVPRSLVPELLRRAGEVVSP